MKYILSLFFIIATMQACSQVVPQKITSTMVKEQEELCKSDDLLRRIDEKIQSLDTLSIQEIKRITHRSYTFYAINKKKIITSHNQRSIKEDSLLNSFKKHYKTEDQSIKTRENTYLKLVNNNHNMYKDTLQHGVYFKQEYRGNKHFIRRIRRDNRSKVSPFPYDKFYSLNSYSEEEVNITNIYYHDSQEKNVPIKIKHNYLRDIPIPLMKYVDSIDKRITIKYLTKVDTIRFYKNEIGVEKKGFTLLKMEDNYVEYTSPYNPYNYYKGKVLKETFYNKKGEALEEKRGVSEIPLESAEEYYQTQLQYFKNRSLLIKELKKRKDIYNALKYAELLYVNKYLKIKRKQCQTVKGNVASLKLYVENQRDSLVFDVRFRSAFPTKNLFIHRLNDKTEFIDKNGKILFQIPSTISFLYNQTTDSHLENYFNTTGDDNTKTFYFLDLKNKECIKLPYIKIGIISPSLLYGMDVDNKFQLISAYENKVLIDKKFINFTERHYIERSIRMHTQENSYYIFDQNNKLIEPQNSTRITKITLKKIE